MYKKITSIILSVLLIAFTLKNISAQEEILFWHSMGGANEEQINKIVEDFNASQSDFKVEAVNQGKYDESTSTFFNLNNTEGRPSLIQIGEQNLQSMIDSKLVTPFNDLIEKYDFPEEELLEGAISFYTYDDKLYAMPFNVSSPLIYYNIDALKAAGYEEAPKTYEEILEMADIIKEKNNGMKVFGMHPYAYAVEQMVTNVGGFIINNDNGRSDRATEVAYQPQLTRIFNFFSELQKNDNFGYYGTNFDDVLTAFNNNEIAMFITTSAVARSVIDNSTPNVGIAYLPTFEDIEREGIYAAGGAITIPNNLSETEEQGVMEFLKFATSSETQATWAGGTGYFPVNKLTYDSSIWKDIIEEYPGIQIAADQLLTSKNTKVTAGPLLSILPQLRTDLSTSLEMVFTGANPEDAVNQAAELTNGYIEAANAGQTE